MRGGLSQTGRIVCSKNSFNRFGFFLFNCLSDPVSLEVIRQMDMSKPFIQYQIDEETIICSGITSKELEVSFFLPLVRWFVLMVVSG